MNTVKSNVQGALLEYPGKSAADPKQKTEEKNG